MAAWRWIKKHWAVAAVFGGLALLVAVGLGLGIWFGLDWKALIGWKALVSYINPEDATERKDAVQVYAVIVAGVVATITAAVGLLNLRLTRRNLVQQRELEAQRGQSTALQAYYEQIGKLITDKDSNLLNAEGDTKKVIRELARGQTLTVLRGIDGNGKGDLITFLYEAGLIKAGTPIVKLNGADLRRANLNHAYLNHAHLWRADLNHAYLHDARLREAYLRRADLRGADLQGAHLQGAHLQGAHLRGADLQGAHLRGADLQGADLSHVKHLTQAQIKEAVVDESTKLPDYPKPPHTGA